MLDFGISKMVDSGPASAGLITRDNSPMGTPPYMSPEQVRASPSIDGRADIWALGVIFFELLTGRPPFEAECVADILIKIATDPTPSLRDLRPDVPADLEALIFKCLEKEPARRFRTVGELARALLPFTPPEAPARLEILPWLQGGAGPAVSAAGAFDSAPPGPPPEPAAQPVERGLLSPPRRPRALVGTGVVALALVVGVVVTFSWASRLREGGHRDSRAIAERTALALEPAQSHAAASSSVPSIDVSDLPPAPPPAAEHPDAPPRSPSEPPAASPVQPPTASAPTAALRPPVPRINCVPPYVIDSAGKHRYKLECL